MKTLLQAVCSAGSAWCCGRAAARGGVGLRFTARPLRSPIDAQEPGLAKARLGVRRGRESIPKNPADRLDYGTLGEYALYFGDGFMIHGRSTTLLGRAVSHGCIRVGRDDLRKVWANARIGTQIYIY